MAQQQHEISKKRVKYETKFTEGWLVNPMFADFLLKKRDSEGKFVPHCRICNVNICMGKSAIMKHKDSKSHQETLRLSKHIAKTNTNIETFFKRSSDSASKMEIKMCSFIAENNLPISLSEDLLALLKSMFPTDETLKTVTLGKQKATNTIRQVLGFHYLKENVDKLKTTKFSLIIDETTDKATTSQMAVIATYFDEKEFRLNKIFVDLIDMPDGKADTIYASVIKCFKDKNIPMENVIGFCADTCNVMFGKQHSVSQLLVHNHPWIIPVKCSCHLIHLCASHAAKTLPKSLEDLCRNVYSHFRLSSQRCDTFKEFQQFLQIDQHQMLRAGQTRWLSMKMCVDRMLEQYEALKLYFRGLALEDPTHTNDSITKSINNMFTRAYLEFMSFNLGRLTSFNTLFQSEIPLLHVLKGEVRKLLLAISSDFMDLSYVRKSDPFKIDVNLTDQHVTLNKVYTGVNASSIIHDIGDDLGIAHPDIKLFQTHCKAFLVESFTQIQRRFSNLEELDFLKCLDPANAYNLSMPSLAPLYNKLRYLDGEAPMQDVDAEWRAHALCPMVNGSMSVEDYWKRIFNQKDAVGNISYPNLNKVITILLSFPFSNAAVERVFSQLKLIKNDNRTSLKQESLVGLLVTKLSFQQHGCQQAAKLNPCKAMVKLHSRMKANASNDEVATLRQQFLAE